MFAFLLGIFGRNLLSQSVPFTNALERFDREYQLKMFRYMHLDGHRIDVLAFEHEPIAYSKRGRAIAAYRHRSDRGQGQFGNGACGYLQ